VSAFFRFLRHLIFGPDDGVYIQQLDRWNRSEVPGLTPLDLPPIKALKAKRVDG
jgi:hypothetical protein